MVPSSAVTTTVTSVEPPGADSATAWLARPLATARPLTVIEALASLAVAVTVREATVAITLAVYVVVPPANTGPSVPDERARPPRAASAASCVAVTGTVPVVRSAPPPWAVAFTFTASVPFVSKSVPSCRSLTSTRSLRYLPVTASSIRSTPSTDRPETFAVTSSKWSGSGIPATKITPDRDTVTFAPWRFFSVSGEGLVAVIAAVDEAPSVCAVAAGRMENPRKNSSKRGRTRPASCTSVADTGRRVARFAGIVPVRPVLYATPYQTMPTPARMLIDPLPVVAAPALKKTLPSDPARALMPIAIACWPR